MMGPRGFVDGSPVYLGAPREQELMPPLLFSLTPQHDGPGSTATPRSTTRTAPDFSMSAQRRSGATPQSTHTDVTPPPPPVTRLTDDVAMEDPSTSARSGQYGFSPYQSLQPHHPPPPQSSHLAHSPKQQRSPYQYGGAAQQQLWQQQQHLAHFEAAPQFEDVWVTVYGFSQAEVPLILTEFAKCGEILQWGTYGQPQANFLHMQFQNKYAAQRALLRNGESITHALIVGVKPLDLHHRLAIEGYDATRGSPMQVVAQQRAAPERPYHVESSGGAQQVPQPSRGMISKVAQYVFGV